MGKWRDASWPANNCCMSHYKNGNKLHSKKYTWMPMLNVIYKIFTNIINTIPRKTHWRDTRRLPMQRKGQPTSDQIFTLWWGEVHKLFVDFKQAYASINQQLYIIMMKFHIPTASVNQGKVQICGSPSDSSETTSGLRQGDSLSTIPFNLTLEKIMCSTTVNPRSSILSRTRQYMVCADGSVINGRSTQVIKRVIQEME
jgi:Reverse transcriptase (RNA-dependent DNA polymerase).